MRKKSCPLHRDTKAGCLDCRSKHRAWLAEWRLKNPEKAQAAKERKNRRRRQNRQHERVLETIRALRIKTNLFQTLGGRCIKCGISDIRVLTINHINPVIPARARIKTVGTGYRLYSNLLRGKGSLSELELRCFNCNTIYEYERGRLRYPVGWHYKTSELAEEIQWSVSMVTPGIPK